MSLLEYSLLAASSLFVIVDPFAVIPAFIAMTPHDTPADRSRMAKVACLVVAGVLLGFGFAGKWIFQFLGITMPAFQIAASIVLLLVSLDMLRAQRSRVQETREETAEGMEKADIAITPLAIPMLAGPGAISTVVLLQSEAVNLWYSLALCGCILLVSLATYGVLRMAAQGAKAMSPIAVIVDEADAQLGNRASSGDSGVSSRVFAQIAQFMGNTEMRGKVIWFLLTCRPDLLPVDLKRQGRAEEHIALFYPHTDEDRLAMLHAVLKKTGVELASAEAEAAFLKHAAGLSGADVEAILTRAKMKNALENQAGLEAADLVAALEDFIPPSYPTEIELQTLVAVLECTSKSLLPEEYRAMDRGEIIRRTNQLAMLSRMG